MRRRTVLGIALSVVLAAGMLVETATGPAASGAVAAAPPNLAAVNAKLVKFATGLSRPVAIAWRKGDARLYVAEQGGKVRIVSGGHPVSTVLDLTAVVATGGEQGLLGITFSSDGTKLYADFTGRNGDIYIFEWTMNGDVADRATGRPLIGVSHHVNANHNSGQILFGADNMLYASIGDGGGAGDQPGNAQNLGTLLGKIIRIDPRPLGTAKYRIPPDNPFVGQAGKRPEIWMYGLRNAWRWTFDRATRDMWIGDVGQALWEEVDFAPAGMKGTNWGWNQREGFHPYLGRPKPPGARDPILEHSHDNGDCAVTGGYVYRGTLIPNLVGGYVYGDFCVGKLLAVAQSGGTITQTKDLGLTVPQLSTFGQGPFGELYPVSLSGTIWVLRPA